MTTILIMEGNTPDVIASGVSGAASFVSTFLTVAPAVQLRVVAPYAGRFDEAVFDGVDGVVFTGSGTRWNTHATQVDAQMEAMVRSFGAGLPVWGSCNGMQLAAVVLGGVVDANPIGLEVGFARDVTKTDEGQRHPMMMGREDVFAVPTVHRDEVQRVPDGAKVLAANAHSAIQAMVYERNGIDFWGTQYHPELSARDIATFIRAPGIFGEKIDLASDLEVAEVDPLAAQRLGLSELDLSVEHRARELLNWLSHIEQRELERLDQSQPA